MVEAIVSGFQIVVLFRTSYYLSRSKHRLEIIQEGNVNENSTKFRKIIINFPLENEERKDGS